MGLQQVDAKMLGNLVENGNHQDAPGPQRPLVGGPSEQLGQANTRPFSKQIEQQILEFTCCHDAQGIKIR